MRIESVMVAQLSEKWPCRYGNWINAWQFSDAFASFQKHRYLINEETFSHSPEQLIWSEDHDDDDHFCSKRLITESNNSSFSSYPLTNVKLNMRLQIGLQGLTEWEINVQKRCSRVTKMMRNRIKYRKNLM